MIFPPIPRHHPLYRAGEVRSPGKERNADESGLNRLTRIIDFLVGRTPKSSTDFSRL